jgi:hypothetical protein
MKKWTMGFIGALFLFPPVSNAMSPNVCDQSDSGERMKCKFQNIIEQQNESADKLVDMGTIPKERTDKLKRQIGKTMATQGKTEAENFKQLTKKNNTQCDTVELLDHMQANGDGDGICENNETCEEDNSDQIGNNDGVCSPTKGKKREVCLQICDDEAIKGNPNNFDDAPGSRGADFDEVLDDITSDYLELNESLNEQMTVQASLVSLDSTNSECSSVLSARPTKKQLDNSFMAAYIAENLSEQADNICGLDAAGFNAHVACIVTDAIFIVAKGIADTITSANDDVDSQTTDAIMRCVQALEASAGEQQDQLEAIESKMDVLDSKMNSTLQKLQESIDLLNTPQGQRNSFPEK